MLNLAIFASGNGSNLQAIIDAIKNKKLLAKINIVLSNNSNAFALQRAKKHKIPSIHISQKTHPNAEQLDNAIANLMSSFDVDTIALAGYMKKVGPQTIESVKGRVLNIHPALLPKFGGEGMFGINVHKAVLAAKEKYSGATVHLVDNIYDNGRIIAQEKITVRRNYTLDTLAKKVQNIEHKLYPFILNEISIGNIYI